MSRAEQPIALGSASPRRRDILTDLGILFFTCPAHIDETPIAGELAKPYLERIVADKLTAVRQLLARDGDAPVANGSSFPRCSAVIVADTTVVVDEKIVGKPEDVQAAFETLRSLSGREHRVLTRYAVALWSDQAASQAPFSTVFRTVESKVVLRAASDDVLRRYAATGEGLDKAGAYAVQGIGSFLVERIEGSYSNVVGLPACELVLDLTSVGLIPDFPDKSGACGNGR